MTGCSVGPAQTSHRALHVASPICSLMLLNSVHTPSRSPSIITHTCGRYIMILVDPSHMHVLCKLSVMPKNTAALLFKAQRASITDRFWNISLCAQKKDLNRAAINWTWGYWQEKWLVNSECMQRETVTRGTMILSVGTVKHRTQREAVRKT